MLHYLAVWDEYDGEGKIFDSMTKNIEVQNESEVSAKIHKLEVENRPIFNGHILIFCTIIKL